MLRVGIIGAGTISKMHIEAYKKNENVKILAIADVNLESAKSRAEEYGIEFYYDDYLEILKNKDIDAVSIATPTFTHKNIILDAVKCGKHILCEKPPAMNAEEVEECIKATENYDKCLMFAFICRFRNEVQYLKKYVESGKMGKIVCGNVTRTSRMSKSKGWFADKAMGGGILRDVGIHEIDTLMYLMGHPKIKSVLGVTSNINSSLPEKVKDGACDKPESFVNRTTEDVVNAVILTENGASITIKLSSVLFTTNPQYVMEIHGEKAGASMCPFVKDKRLEMVELTDDMFITETKPVIEAGGHFENEINHFVDCCENKTPCICKIEEALLDMQIIDAIYKSAEIGKAINF